MELGLAGWSSRQLKCKVNHLVVNNLFGGAGGWSQRADRRPHAGCNVTPPETPETSMSLQLMKYLSVCGDFLMENGDGWPELRPVMGDGD